ncbi:hypothetical protein SAMN05444156_0778 [Verrucomicrobium sp. GAS474]|uniref:hypothetical protein n=1 Tax=Verrucomicrobium sp. GAS474 TaxID=1882831 RepID=UPI00087BADAD|nr:hypothetical protein [Verrucomicrobium sp. GAS474]SDT92324.1 hypothetical protein SAMN05444156_0778 [Verrucomicrobium sp. GAS474]
MNKRTPKTFANRLQDHIAAAAAFTLNRTRTQTENSLSPRLSTLPEGTFAWAPIIVRPRSQASRWIE